ncbi:MAG: protein kinase [Litoreibacter sp.]
MQQDNTQHDAPLAGEELPVGTTLSDDKFTITGSLGYGGFGITYHATDNVLGRPIVIKECYAEDFCLRDGKAVIARNSAHEKQVRSIVGMFMREARSLARLRHPNIVAVHSAFEENGTAYMALDLIDGPDLLDIIEEKAASFSPERVTEIVLQLLSAITKVHEVGLLHRDIAPDNIIIEKSGSPVLIDFGAARGDASNRTRALSSVLVVKDGYSPQEFYVPGSSQMPSSDLYALGATLYHFLTGEAPHSSQVRLLEISGGSPDPYIPLAGRIDGYGDAFLKAIDTAMRVHPKDRLQSAAEWTEMITKRETSKPSPVKPLPEALVKTTKSAASDTPVDALLNQLIEETNEEVRKSRLIKVEPKVVEASVKASSRPKWVDEFNEETRSQLSSSTTPEQDVPPIEGGTGLSAAEESSLMAFVDGDDETNELILTDENHSADVETIENVRMTDEEPTFQSAPTVGAEVTREQKRPISFLIVKLVRLLLAGIFVSVLIVIALMYL